MEGTIECMEWIRDFDEGDKVERRGAEEKKINIKRGMINFAIE